MPCCRTIELLQMDVQIGMVDNSKWYNRINQGRNILYELLSITSRLSPASIDFPRAKSSPWLKRSFSFVQYVVHTVDFNF
jgi:hypothetical protein